MTRLKGEVSQSKVPPTWPFFHYVSMYTYHLAPRQLGEKSVRQIRLDLTLFNPGLFKSTRLSFAQFSFSPKRKIFYLQLKFDIHFDRLFKNSQTIWILYFTQTICYRFFLYCTVNYQTTIFFQSNWSIKYNDRDAKYINSILGWKLQLRGCVWVLEHLHVSRNRTSF